MGPALLAIGKFIGAVFIGAKGASLAYVVAVNVARVATVALAAKLTAPDLDLEQSAQDKLLTVSDSIQPQQFTYGQDMVSGPLLFANTGGSQNKDLHRLVANLGHEADSIVSYRIDDTTIIVGDEIAAETGSVTSGKFNGVLEIDRRLGTSSQTNLAGLTSAFPVSWTTAHRARGWAITHFDMSLVEGKEDAFDDGIPQNLRTLYKGKKVYDPRKDSTNGGTGSHRLADESTWEWSENPALQWADFMRWDLVGMGEEDDRIDWPLIIGAANICDQTVAIPTSSTQKRYTSNFTFLSTTPRGQIKKILEDAMLGRSVFSQGKWRLWAGAALTPDVTLTEANLRAGLQLQATAGSNGNERFNRVRGKFVDPSRNYQPNPYPEQRSTAFELADGRVIYKTIDFPAANTSFEAQRNAIKTLKRSRNMRVLIFEGNLSCYRVQPGTVVLLNIDELGFAGEKFFVSRTDFVPDMGVNLTLIQETDSDWNDPIEAAYSTRTSTGALVFGNTGVPAPTVGTATGVVGGIALTWTNPPENTFDVIEVHRSTDNDRANARLITTVSGSSYFDQIGDFQTYYYWLRARNKIGQVSSFLPNLTTTTINDEPSLGTPVLNRDPDFDLSSGFDEPNFWEKNTVGGSTITFNSGGGPNGSNYVRIVHGGSFGDFASVAMIHRVRSNFGTFQFRIRYRTTAASFVPTFTIQATGYPSQTGGTANAIPSTPFAIPGTNNAWDQIAISVTAPADDDVQFWAFSIAVGDIAATQIAGTIDIDSIFVETVPEKFGKVIDGKVEPGLVPQAIETDDQFRLLTGEGKWGGPDRKVKSGDTAINSSGIGTTLTDDPHLAGWDLEANTIYKVDGFIYGIYNVGNIKIGFQFSNATQSGRLNVDGSDEQQNIHEQSSLISSTYSIVSFNDSTRFGIKLRGSFVSNNTTGGTLDFQWAQQTASLNNTTLEKGSWIEVEKVG